MKTLRKDLNFLDIFATIANTKTETGDKLKIEVKDKKAYFSLLTKDEALLKTMENIIVDEEFSIVVPVIQFWQLIKSFDEEDLILLKKNTIIVKDAKYSFVTYKLEIKDVKDYIKRIEEVEIQETTVKNIDSLCSIKDFGKGLSNDSICRSSSFLFNPDNLPKVVRAWSTVRHS